MKLSVIIEQARASELDSLSEKSKTDRKIVSYVNLALIALYKRFQLETEEAVIRLRPDLLKTVYTMDSSDPDVTVAGQPMGDDEFMTLIRAYNEDGSDVAINDEKNPFSIFTTAYNQIQVPFLADQGYIALVYRKNPELITYVDDGNGNAVDTAVKIPLQLLEPMLHYVGYRAHEAVNSSAKAENNTHYRMYLASCEEVERMGVLTADDVVNLSVERKGFI